MLEHTYPHVRYGKERTSFETADELAEAVKGLAGEHVSVEFRRESGIVSSLFFTVNGNGTLRASYGSSGFPMEKSDEVTCNDVLAFLEASR